jgi:hypothetical protein
MNKATGNFGKWRRRLGAAALIVGILLTLLFAASARWWIGYGTEHRVIDLGDGTLYTTKIGGGGLFSPLVGWHGGRSARSGSSWTWTWWTWGKRTTGWQNGHAYTLWPMGPALIVAGVALFWPGYRAPRRRRRHQCPCCGYPQAGLPAGHPCPECGGREA